MLCFVLNSIHYKIWEPSPFSDCMTCLVSFETFVKTKIRMIMFVCTFVTCICLCNSCFLSMFQTFHVSLCLPTRCTLRVLPGLDHASPLLMHDVHSFQPHQLTYLFMLLYSCPWLIDST